MKKSAILIPVVLVLALFLFGGDLMKSFTSNPISLLLLPIIGFGMMMIAKPKNHNGAPCDTDETLLLLGDFAKDAFAHNEKLSAQFTSAVSNFLDGKPMAAAGKLEKLKPQCVTDTDTYAVNILLGKIKASKGDYENALDLLNKAVLIHPTTELAMEIGSVQQRIGELEKARSSYEFALDLDPNNIAARSALATAYVGDGMFEEAIEEALTALEMDENHASSLATCAISYGVLDDPLMCKSFTSKAVDNGYSADKINNTITALKKKFKR